MSIPQVSMSWCQHRTKCDWCPEHIESATPLVKAQFSTKNGNGTFITKKYYHPQCWIEQGMDYLKRNPYVSSHKGATPMELSDEDRAKRVKLLKQKGSYDQRLRKLDTSDPQYQLKVAKIRTNIATLIVEIAPLGGIPESWLPKEIAEQIDE